MLLGGAVLGWAVLGWAVPAHAHDLAIDQIGLWPDRAGHALRGELTIDPELTRSKDALPSAEYAQRVLEFLAANVTLSLDGRPLQVPYEVRELWVRGGATLGDLVVFSMALPESSRELQVFAQGFKALVVSVQVPGERSRSQTSSWLLGRGEGTPVYRFDMGGQPSGWKEGGPEAFMDANGILIPNPVAVPASGPASGPVLKNSAASKSELAPQAASSARLALRFVRLGFEHILPGGVDHMLFVAGLVLGNAGRYRRVLLSLTLFTLAHTITLALGNLQVVHVPRQWVEPLIALSICLLGVDNLRRRSIAVTGSDVARQLLVFCFGLIHGLGFANALAELSFDREHLVLALCSFNVGVELGQVAVVVLLGCVLFWIRDPRQLRRYIIFPGSVAIAASGLFLVVERAGLLGSALGL